MKPGLLQALDWRVAVVLTRDWCRQPEPRWSGLSGKQAPAAPNL
jgi:hypothetical protein